MWHPAKQVYRNWSIFNPILHERVDYSIAAALNNQTYSIYVIYHTMIGHICSIEKKEK